MEYKFGLNFENIFPYVIFEFIEETLLNIVFIISVFELSQIISFTNKLIPNSSQYFFSYILISLIFLLSLFSSSSFCSLSLFSSLIEISFSIFGN